MLIVVLLAAGLLGLLALNTALNEGSFELSRLQKQTTVATDEQQGLQHEIDQSSAPDALAKRAAELGMVPAGGMAFLDVPNGKAVGTPGPAQDSPPVKRSTAEPWPTRAQPGTGQPAAPAAAPSPAAPQPGGAPTPAAPPPVPTPAASAGDSVIQLNPASPAAAAKPSGGAAR
ncbi:septum formation initiator family protein [Kitasatospora sp. NPDC002543]